jgi:hypothetical protein
VKKRLLPFVYHPLGAHTKIVDVSRKFNFLEKAAVDAFINTTDFISVSIDAKTETGTETESQNDGLTTSTSKSDKPGSIIVGETEAVAGSVAGTLLYSPSLGNTL